MSDAEVVWMFLFFVAAAYGLYSKFYAVRRLRKKLDRISDAALASLEGSPAAQMPVVAAAPQRESDELLQLRRRVQVLERIATDGNPTLEREFDDLRRVG